MTLDAEADPAPLPSILDTLQEKGVRATIFIQGQFAKANRDLIKRIVDDGHEIGNHSWSHPDFRTLKREQMVEELRKTEEMVKEITGRSTKPYFRPPFSYRNQLSINVAGGEGYLTIVWTTETYDWKKGATAKTMVESVLKEAKPGGIVVMHTSKARDAEALPGIIDALRAEGYTLVTVSEVLAP
ncbi:MAG: polysaccharide deacetylase family protein [Anaerolineae bacterium]|nr:polysaccharide deacetylase family protein [Anaerolineae bacterium]